MFGFENMLHSEFTDMPFKIMFLSIVFLFGICIGSFLNVVILRLPRHESLIKRSSHCMTCGAKIRPIDLIPVLSWILLRGKCHSCGEKISVRYPIVESLNGLLYVLTFIVLDINAKAIITCVLMSLLVVIAFMDWDTQEIDMIIVGMILLLAIPAALFTDDVELKHRIIGALVISVPFFIIGEVSRPIIRKKFEEDFRAIELGDTLLMFAAGALLGTRAIIVSALIGIITAAVGGVIIKMVTKDSKFAFGPYLSIGIAFAMLWGNRVADWYVNLLTAKPE
ncbi:leader peptidase (prepilin peptidase) / N-methyltransferase [Ruminococcus sp. YRD2003]|uniref:prepilin peptidase n=1 Tax=Ruminococcus sp. YRD2003 TaxID=1452313 RepID=UPI0008B8C0F0|nr:leader peptidase (prepilin peptidase) / N-methyltransferase [Ruminococcus flavefaciens]